MGFWLQLSLLLWKNFTLKKRKPLVLVFELFIPLVLFFILIGIRKYQPAYPIGSFTFHAYPLPSAGVIAIMQAFCDNGVLDNNGFFQFPNGTVTSFLERLNTASQNNNFFLPGFKLSELDTIPDIYKSIVEDPVAVHDIFVNAANKQVVYLLKDPAEFKQFLVSDLLVSEDAVKVLLTSSLDMKQVYRLLFLSFLNGTTFAGGSIHQKAASMLTGQTGPLKPLSHSVSELNIPEILPLGHLESWLVFLQKHTKEAGVLWNAVQKIFDLSLKDPKVTINPIETAVALKKLMLSPFVLRTIICGKGDVPTVLKPGPSHKAEEMEFLKEQFCSLSDHKLKVLAMRLKRAVDTEKLYNALHLAEWNFTVAKQRVSKLVTDLRTFHLFEDTLKKVSEIASALPQDSCTLLNGTDVLNNDTTAENFWDETLEDPQEAKILKPNPQYGLLRIWLGMQKTVCGAESKLPPTLPTGGSDINLDDLGLSKYQKEKVELLVHLLYSNPRVLYAPNNTAADQIIKNANETFELLDSVTQYARKMLNVSEEIRAYLAENSTVESLNILKEIRQNLRHIISILNVTNPEALDFANDSIVSDKKDLLAQLDIIDNAACSWISLMSGISLNIFKGFKDEADLLLYFKEKAYFDNVTVLASVIFEMKKDGSLPNHMIYRIRQNASFTPTTNLVRNRFWFPGPRNWGYGYYQFGFVWIQDILERAMINLYVGQEITEPGSYIHEFPYPCFIQDQFLFMIEHVMPFCLIISWVYSVAMLVQNIVYEKEKRLKEVMKTMGLNNAVHWLAWFITSFLQMSVTVIILTIILKCGRVLTYSNPFLIFLTLEIFVIANIMFSFFVSVLYSKAKLAAACAGIIYLLTYVPYMYIAVREEAAHVHVPAWIKSLASLLSTTAFGLGAKYFAFYEEIGVGVQWSNMAVSPMEDDDFSLWNVVIMMLMDTFIYAVLVWYIENVHPGAYGLPKPWYFPFTKSYWLGFPKHDAECSALSDCWKTIKQRNCMLATEDQACAMDTRVCDNRVFESDPIHLPLGVCIDHLLKCFKNGNRLAVNRLSLNLYEGQITAFLGHNGAGKTTTISILTGLFPPTSGYATIYGHDIRTEMDLIRQSMGMCPQHNVLFDELTVEEHLWFYARLKGTEVNDREEELARMIDDLNLPLKSKVEYLSGGMKRKLSVAIAFIGGPRVVILDEPTAGVDPYSRRAIWDFIIKYKKERTILMTTHHMDEADVLGDRIAIITNGQLRCCGTSLFLKNNLGEGYHLFLVKKVSSASNGSPVLSNCLESKVTSFIKHQVSTATLVSESKHELHYVLPTEELRKGSFEKLFKALEINLNELEVSSYGIKNTTLEEIFLQVAQSGMDKYQASSSSDSYKSNRSSNKSPSVKDFTSLFEMKSDDKQTEPHESGDTINSSVPLIEGNNCHEGVGKAVPEGEVLDDTFGNNQDEFYTVADGNQEQKPNQSIGVCEGAGSYQVHGKLLLIQQFLAILTKRYYCTRRNWKGLFSQILLPAFFVIVAMSVALTAPNIEDLPPIFLSPSQYYNYTQPDGNVIPYANHNQDELYHKWSKDALSNDLVRTLHMPSGVGATCVLKSPFNNSFDSHKLNFSVRNFELLSAFFEPMCQSVFVPGLPLENFVPPLPTVSPFEKDDLYTHTGRENGSWIMTTMPPGSKDRYYPYCHCSKDKTGFVCQPYGYKDPPFFKVVTGDILLDITGQNEHEYYLYTTDMFRLRRYGAFSFGLVKDYVPPNFGENAPPLFRKIAVRNIAKIWYNNKGFHSIPTYINSMNNAILRANLPEPKGNPSAYGITVINHPMTDTSYMPSKDQILQGTDVLIAIFIIVAMSFVPASFVLFLVYERYIKARHLQAISGVNTVIYWVGNYFWDMCNYVVPATCCILILRVFDIPAYSSDKNFPAVVSLFLMYGWSITPVMYPVSFLFKEPSTAYIFLIVINLFVGITCIVTSFLLEVFSYNAYLGEIHTVLKATFLLFPNYCLGRGLMDIAFNEYQNFFLFKTGQYNKMRSPFAWDLVTRNLIAMAISGLSFFLLTLLCDFHFFIKPKNIKVPEYPLIEDDEDVDEERERILRGLASSDVLQLVNLTKVYKTRKLGKHLAVDRLCLGVPEGECFGLLGVNGAGKSTTFKMLTGDTFITAGDAYLNGYSVYRELHKVQQYLGYCPQFDALYDELTARDHLQLYARFRGIPRKEEKKIVEWALTKLDLSQYANKTVGTFSGGNKRKLSTAIALLGAPPVIFLDEPTTGMDPFTRRFLWNLIIDIVRGGRCVILTSHSMEECEALCTRLAIMVNGHFKCLGSIQHLKNRFGEGYYITIRTKENEVDFVERWFRQTFRDAILKEKHYNMLQFELKSENISLAYVFSKMEAALTDLPIGEYSVCQNTLDNVFINFVKQQSDRSVLSASSRQQTYQV